MTYRELTQALRNDVRRRVIPKIIKAVLLKGSFYGF